MEYICPISRRSAEISIRLRNEGVDAFEVDRYGRCINVVRTLQLSKKSAQSLDGGDVGKADALQATSTYQLRGENNRAVSKKAADLDRLLLHFGIDIENPLTILQQETAKQFLANTTAQRRYEVRLILFLIALHIYCILWELSISFLSNVTTRFPGGNFTPFFI